MQSVGVPSKILENCVNSFAIDANYASISALPSSVARPLEIINSTTNMKSMQAEEERHTILQLWKACNS
jgi:hypothetical protein